MTKIVHYSCVYDEETHARQWIENVLDVADTSVVYDDGSTDGTVDILREYLPEDQVILGGTNNWSEEFTHYAAAFRRVCELEPTHIVAWAADERIPGQCVAPFRERVLALKKGQAIALKHAECYRSRRFWRGDGWWSSNAYTRHWRHDPSVLEYYNRRSPGVHCVPIPMLLERGFEILVPHGIRTVHLGWGSRDEILAKFDRYAALVDAGTFGRAQKYMNFLRFLDEQDAHYNPMPREWMCEPWMRSETHNLEPRITTDDGAPAQLHDHGWIIDHEDPRWRYIRKLNPSRADRLTPRRVRGIEVSI